MLHIGVLQLLLHKRTIRTKTIPFLRKHYP